MKDTTPEKTRPDCRHDYRLPSSHSLHCRSPYCLGRDTCYVLQRARDVFIHNPEVVACLDDGRYGTRNGGEGRQVLLSDASGDRPLVGGIYLHGLFRLVTSHDCGPCNVTGDYDRARWVRRQRVPGLQIATDSRTKRCLRQGPA